MTKLNEQDLQNVTGGVTRMTQNNSSSGSAGSYKPDDDSTTEAK